MPFILMALGGLIGIIILRLRQPKETDDGAQCGKCKYSVRGLPNLDCPECGSDLREVGIKLPPRRGQLMKVFLLLLGAQFFGMLIYYGIMAWAPQLTSLFYLVVPLALGGLIVMLIVQRFRRLAHADDGGECGNCSFSARDFPGLDCPECDSDLREVGIVLAPQPPSKNRIWFALIASLVFMAILFGANFLEDFMDKTGPPMTVAPLPVPVNLQPAGWHEGTQNP